MVSGLLYAAALPLELCGLFAIWNWSVRRRRVWWLLGGGSLLIGLLLALTLTTPHLPSRMYLAFAGMYLFSGLMWAWWVDGLHPSDWAISEIGVSCRGLVRHRQLSPMTTRMSDHDDLAE